MDGDDKESKNVKKVHIAHFWWVSISDKAVTLNLLGFLNFKIQVAPF